LEAFRPAGDHELIEGLAAVGDSGFKLPEDGAGLFNEGSFYPAFLSDIDGAKESIVLFSPFATEAGTSRWIEPLRIAILRGVHVRLLTRPPTDGGAGPSVASPELVQSLRSLGIIVDLRSQMHEKIAVVDGNVLWHGSLNVLSHRNTHESMLRIESRAVCDMIGRLVSKDGSRRDRPDLHAAENPKCGVCGGSTIWVGNRAEITFRCEDRDCSGTVGSQRRDNRPQRNRPERPSADGPSRDGVSCPREGCDGRLRERTGRFGPFLGCSRFPICTHTQNVR
jgi:hypothetical protein